MKTASVTQSPRDTLKLRIPPAERNLIDRAAEAAGKIRTAFHAPSEEAKALFQCVGSSRPTDRR